MSSLSRPELSPSWWKDVRPEHVRGRDLEKALKEIVAAEKACARDPSQIEPMEKAVKALQRAVTRTNRECDDDADEEVLDALGELVDLAEERLEELEGIADDPLFSIQELRELMRKLKRTPMSFAAGLGKGDTTFLALDPYQQGLQLSSKLRQASGASVTYGVASAEGKEIRLEVHGPSVSGLEKRLRDFLRRNQPLPFQRVRVEGKKRQKDEEAEPEAKAGGGKPEANALAVARKIAKAVNGQRKKLDEEVQATVGRLREIEEQASGADGEGGKRARELREALEGAAARGRAQVKEVKDAAEELVERKSAEARKTLERAARKAGRSFDEARRQVSEGRDWLDSRG